MADAEVFGLPKVMITFKTKSTTAIARSARGIMVMILKEEDTDISNHYSINDITDIPDNLSAANVDLVKKALLGVPYRILVYTMPTDDVTEATIQQEDVCKQLVNIKWNYICAPTGNTQEQEDLAAWVKSMRINKDKTFKAVVANVDADNQGIINFTTGKIRVNNPAYSDALALAGYDESKVPAAINKYNTYTAAQYTARIAGILAGLPLDRSATYYELAEVVDCETYEDIDNHINNGELVLFDEYDGNGVKIGRACNSLHTFTTDVGQDFRFIKIMECLDMVKDDIRDTFKGDYTGKVINDYNHKMLLIQAIMVYLSGLKGNVLDASESAINEVDIDTQAQKNYAVLHGDDTSNMSYQQIREYNTGTNVFLKGRITPVNAMEDLKIDFLM